MDDLYGWQLEEVVVYGDERAKEEVRVCVAQGKGKVRHT